MILLQVTAAVLSFVILLGAAWFAVEFTNRRPHVGTLLLFGWLAIFAFFIERPELFVRNVGGINFVVPDILCTFLALVAVLRFLIRPPAIPRRFLLPVLTLGGLLLLSYLRGLFEFGLQHATNEFREFFYFLSALAFTISFPPKHLAERIPAVALIGGILLGAVAVARLPQMHGFGLDERPIPSYAALALGQAFFFGWAWIGVQGKPAVWRWSVMGFLLLAFFMLHRSVWLALAAGLLALIAFERQNRRPLLRTMVVLGILGAVGLGVFAGNQVLSGLHQAVDEATSSDQSTFLWRLEGWKALLSSDNGLDIGNLMFGKPMGSGYARALENSVLNTSEIDEGVIPHNYYISLILRGGLFGVAALIVLYGALLKLLLQQMRALPSHAYAGCFLAVLITQLVYYVPYSADMIQGVFLGGSVALASGIYVSRMEGVSP